MGIRGEDQVTGGEAPRERHQGWDSAIAAVRKLLVAVGELQAMDRASLTELVEVELANAANRDLTLVILANLEPDVTKSVLAILVPLACSDRYAMRVRQILGRVDRATLESHVPAIVDGVLDDADELGYRRIAELLAHLGLSAALERLRQRAAQSDNVGIQEIDQDFVR